MVKKKIKKFPIHYDCQGHFRNIYFTIYISLSAYNRILQRGKIIKKFPKSICFNLSNRFELFVVVGIVVYDYSTKWTLKCTNSWIKWESHNKLDDWRFWNIRQSNAIQLATDYPLKPRRIIRLFEYQLRIQSRDWRIIEVLLYLKLMFVSPLLWLQERLIS